MKRGDNVYIGKYLIDRVCASIGLVLLSPLLALLVVLVRWKLGSPVFFRRQRPGFRGRPFTILKFRTMTDARDPAGNLLPDAGRLTAFGRWLRRASLDELPELFNVLKGGMSLVGPRPLLMEYLPRYTPEDKLNEMAAEAGFKSWVLLFQQKAKLPENPELPTVGPWRTVTPITGQLFTLERNPYYWAVDPKGNQLPYIDRLEMRLVQDLEVLTMRAMAGEIDMQERHIQLAKYPAFKEAAQKGNYRCDLRVMRRRRS